MTLRSVGVGGWRRSQKRISSKCIIYMNEIFKELMKSLRVFIIPQLSRPTGYEWGSLINLEERNGRARDTRNAGKEGFLIKPRFIISQKLFYSKQARGRGGC